MADLDAIRDSNDELPAYVGGLGNSCNSLIREVTMLTRLRAFLLGLWEFRSDTTTHFGYPLIETYDWGREWAHRLTFRVWDR